LDLDKDNLLIQYLSEKILYEIKDEELGSKALKVAEQKMKYISKIKAEIDGIKIRTIRIPRNRN